jgi:hypothetical protein
MVRGIGLVRIFLVVGIIAIHIPTIIRGWKKWIVPLYTTKQEAKNP